MAVTFLAAAAHAHGKERVPFRQESEKEGTTLRKGSDGDGKEAIRTLAIRRQPRLWR